MIISSPLDLQLLVKNLQFEDGKMIAAAQYFSAGSSAAVELTEEEKTFAEQMRVGPPLRRLPAKLIFVNYKMSHADDNVSLQAVWQSILSNVSQIEDSTDFFKSGAASMDVVR